MPHPTGRPRLPRRPAAPRTSLNRTPSLRVTPAGPLQASSGNPLDHCEIAAHPLEVGALAAALFPDAPCSGDVAGEIPGEAELNPCLDPIGARRDHLLELFTSTKRTAPIAQQPGQSDTRRAAGGA